MLRCSRSDKDKKRRHTTGGTGGGAEGRGGYRSFFAHLRIDLIAQIHGKKKLGCARTSHVGRKSKLDTKQTKQTTRFFCPTHFFYTKDERHTSAMGSLFLRTHNLGSDYRLPLGVGCAYCCPSPYKSRMNEGSHLQL